MAKDSNGVIDLDAEDDTPAEKQIIDVDAGEEKSGDEQFVPVDESQIDTRGQTPAETTAQNLGDVADEVRARPPTPREPEHRQPSPPKSAAKAPFMEADSDDDSDTSVSQPEKDANRVEQSSIHVQSPRAVPEGRSVLEKSNVIASNSDKNVEAITQPEVAPSFGDNASNDSDEEIA